MSCVSASQYWVLIWVLTAGNLALDFIWPADGVYHPWESFLYALCWLQLVVIGLNLEFHEELWRDHGFPHVPASTQHMKLQPLCRFCADFICADFDPFEAMPNVISPNFDLGPPLFDEWDE